MSAHEQVDSFEDMTSLRFRELLIRSAYRGVLERLPEEKVAEAFREKGFSPAFEDEMSDLVRSFVESEEFRGRIGANPRAPVPDYSPDTWVMAIVDGLKMWVDIGDRGVSRTCMLGAYEPVETNFVDMSVKPGMTFVDIGANIGWFSLRAARLAGPTGKVISFEPRKLTFEALSRSMAENTFTPNFEGHNVALGTEQGEITIGCSLNSDNPGGTWTIPTASLEDQFRAAGAMLQRVNVLRLDDVLAGRKVDFIKIDIEGAEPLAMGGATETLLKSRPIIMSEINPEVLEIVSSSTPDAYVRWMKDHKYNCFHLTMKGVGAPYNGGPLSGGETMINVVFLPA